MPDTIRSIVSGFSVKLSRLLGNNLLRLFCMVPMLEVTFRKI